jgi:hypothetical protein
MARHASGTFEVKLVPQPPEDKAVGSTLARMSIDKQSGYGTNGKGVQFGALFLLANVLYSTAIARPVVHSHY